MAENVRQNVLRYLKFLDSLQVGRVADVTELLQPGALPAFSAATAIAAPGLANFALVELRARAGRTIRLESVEILTGTLVSMVVRQGATVIENIGTTYAPQRLGPAGDEATSASLIDGERATNVAAGAAIITGNLLINSAMFPILLSPADVGTFFIVQSGTADTALDVNFVWREVPRVDEFEGVGLPLIGEF